MRILFLGGPWDGSLKGIPETNFWEVSVPGERERFMYEAVKVAMFGRWGIVMLPVNATQEERDALAVEAFLTEKGKEALSWTR